MTLEGLRARRDDILRIAATHDAHNVRVFGSVARNEADTGSDVDFLVDLPPRYRGFDYFGILDSLREALEDTLGCRVDVLSIRGVTQRSKDIAARIEHEAVPL